MTKKERTYANFGEYLYWSYANIQMLHYALNNGVQRYNRMCYMIRAKAFKAYKEGRWNIHDLFEFNITKIKHNDYCWYCGKEMEPSKLTKDHVFPRSKGGVNEMDNIIMVCKTCNSSKGNMDLFEWYFRNALVRANYSDLTNGITETTEYLERFFRSMLLGEEHDLRNRIMHVDWNKVEDETISQSANHEVQSAKAGEELPPKCKNCTLEEVALLRIVQKNPSATQKEIAAEIGKSERTVKSITIALQEKNILRRVNGKRNGYWEIVED